MKSPLLAAVLLLGFVGIPPGAAADSEVPSNSSPWSGEEPDHQSTVESDGETTITLFQPGSEQEPAVSVSFDGNGNASVTSNLVPVRVREISTVPPEHRDEDPHFQGSCIRLFTIMVTAGTEDETRATYEEAMEYTIRAIFPGTEVQIPQCRTRPGDDVPDPGAALNDMLEPFIEQLPRPVPVLNPEAAVTGIDTYLQTNRPLTYGPVDGTIDLGGASFPVTLWAEGAYMVDWGQQDDGDGPAFQQVTGPHTIPGRPYEDGRSPDDEAVTHVYTSTPDGSLTVSVTDRWIVHYSIAGVVDDATIVAELDPVTVDVEVVEYQAVLVSE